MSEADRVQALAYAAAAQASAIASVLGNAPDIPSEAHGWTAYRFMRWVADRCLEWYDQGRAWEAIGLYLYLMGLHSPPTQWVARQPATIILLQIGSAEGRTGFEHELMGFIVPGSPVNL